MSTTIRIEDDTKRRVRELTEATGIKMQDVVEAAVADYERKVFWERINASCAKPRGDREEWARVSAKREDESGALLDES